MSRILSMITGQSFKRFALKLKTLMLVDEDRRGRS